MKQYDVIIIGGGAAGFFAAINIADKNPDLIIAILERSGQVLSKVKVSGGGRCNVTHGEFDPKELVKNYPRGEKELIGPFHKFMTGDTIDWFQKRGVELKIEEDGRMFPKSDSSQSIIDCFLNEVHKYRIEVLKNNPVKNISKNESYWEIITKEKAFSCNKILVATGSNSKIWDILHGLGHTIVKPVPSLFTFNINDERIKNIPGVVVENVTIKVLDSYLSSFGPLLITHWGLSAPAILKLSAFGALEFANRGYKFKIEINFVNLPQDEVLHELRNYKQSLAKKTLFNSPQFELPKRLWNELVKASGIIQGTRWADLNKNQLEDLSSQLTEATFQVDGKSTFKEEFVTAGGIDLKEINFKTFESKLHKDLYFAGEILNIDAVTGGFNFQNAWTGAFIAADAIALN